MFVARATEKIKEDYPRIAIVEWYHGKDKECTCADIRSVRRITEKEVQGRADENNHQYSKGIADKHSALIIARFRLETNAAMRALLVHDVKF